MQKDQNQVTIVGAGPAGLLLATLLAQQGRTVRVLEARSEVDLFKTGTSRPRSQNGGSLPASSINLALSYRGLNALRCAGALGDVRPLLTPMLGRQIHGLLQHAFHSYDLVGRCCIFSIRRAELMAVLYRSAIANGAAVVWGARVTAVDPSSRELVILSDTGAPVKERFSVLIGADGVRSVVRATIDRAYGLSSTVAQLDHSFVDMPIERPNAPEPFNALHIWPRNDFMLVSLPNNDLTATATLFAPDSMMSECMTMSGAIRRRFMAAHFSDIVDSLIHDADAHRVGRILTSAAARWHVGGDLCILGDAAHTMAPFFGQGINCAFEDCLHLANHLQATDGRYSEAFALLEADRKDNAVAIGQLSLAHYLEMRATVSSDEYLRRREISRECQERWPSRFVPLYAMVSFSEMPYAIARQRHVTQEEIVTDACSMMRQGGLDWRTIEAQVETLLSENLFLPDATSEDANALGLLGNHAQPLRSLPSE